MQSPRVPRCPSGIYVERAVAGSLVIANDAGKGNAVIQWLKFDWPTFGALVGAIVTLIVGLAAVRGAKAIGLKQAGIAERQVEISDRQTAILGRQVELEEQKLVHDLFERRYRAFDAAANLLAEAVEGNRHQFSSKTSSDYLTALQESRFLFPINVHTALQDIWSDANASLALTRKAFDTVSRSQTPNPDDLTDQETLVSSLKWRGTILHELFPQLNLMPPGQERLSPTTRPFPRVR